MIRSLALPYRVISAVLVLAAGAMPSVSHAACTSNISTLDLGAVANVAQLKAKLGEYANGTYVQGTNPPIQVSFTQCAASVTTTVIANSVSLSTSGQTVTVRAILVSVNGVPLGTPKDLLTTSHSFTGDSTLAIAIVPSSPLPTTLKGGNYSGFLSLSFTDPN